jgi:hypothetical protein
MSKEQLLRQISEDNEKIAMLSEHVRLMLDLETDWDGFRYRGYRFPKSEINQTDQLLSH